MSSLKKLTNEEYSFLNLMENLDSKDVKSMCLVNKDFQSLCNQYLNSIYKKLLKRDFKIDVQNNKVYQVLYDIVNGVYTKDSNNVYLSSFLYDQINSEQVFNLENISKILEVIKFTKNPDIEDVNKLTPTMLAVSLNSPKYLKKILEYKPDINKRDINNFNILTYAINLKSTLGINSDEIFNIVLSLKPQIENGDVEDAISNLNLDDFKLFRKTYMKELKNSDVLYFGLELCKDTEVLRYIVKNFYEQFDENRDIFEAMVNNDLDIETVKEMFKEILRLNKIDIKQYVKNKIGEYNDNNEEEKLIGFLIIVNDLIDINEIIEYIMKETSDSVKKTVFETYNNINLNLNTQENKSVFKYLLETEVPLIVIKETHKLDYNEIIKELIYIPEDVKNKKEYIQNNKVYLSKLKQKLNELRSAGFTNNFFSIDLFNRLTVVLFMSALILKVDKEREKTLDNMNNYAKNKTITDKIDLKYWLSII